ncbi:hypothetical protein [Paenarthrobacter nitroguajacolicus]|uniref:hypothetical protein n=1 Tax=Paenarthrobacter nitroguajacolicus TaxID=211146 RepID=UPI00248CBFED|nr:hypothetical protein [Paenarthrobacter nitroguajacolicus]MDI2034566.1 hypothetical protein [Paenarthrobacter nitroguajacolicus]
MNALLIVMLLAIAAVVGILVGRSQGRRAAPRDNAHSGMADPQAYQAGFLAGHVAGWRDAETKLRGSSPPQVRSASVNPAGPAVPWAPARQAAVPIAPTPLTTVASSAFVPSVAVPPVAQPSQVPQLVRETPAEVAARKAKRDQQNINITLYVASLLLVAAGALFVGTSLPELFRFGGIWFITAMFYVSGLVIHAKIQRLRPAAIAFVGTGLALIPVTGLAMYSFVIHNGAAAWLVTSLLGTILYAYTAVRLDNKILAFLSLSFVVSTAWSGVSILGGALVWYFTALIGVAILLTLGAMLRPRWIPPLYVRPLMLLHPYVVPLVALAVTITPNLLSRGEYALVMLMCGSYFSVMVLVPQARYRLQHFYAARAALTLALLGLVWDVTADVSALLMAAVVCLGVQSLGVAFGGNRLAPRLWWSDAVACWGLQLASSAVLTAVLGIGDFDLPVQVPLYVTLLTAMVLGWRLGRGPVSAGAAMLFAPAAAVGVGLALAFLLGAWPVALVTGTTGCYWFLMAVLSPAVYRQQLVLAARIALTAAAPILVAAIFEGSPDRFAFALLSLVAAAGVQEVASAVLFRSGVRLVAPQVTAAAFAGAGMAVLLLLPVVDHAAGRPTVSVAVVLVLIAGVASGMLLLSPTKGSLHQATWSLNTAEVLPPVTAVVAGAVAASAVSLTLANIVLLVAVAYFGATALRITALYHRQSYWWLARAAGSLLIASAYVDALHGGWSPHIAGEIPGVPLLAAAVAVAQLAFPLSGRVQGRFPRASVIEAAVLMAVMAGAATVLTLGATVGGWLPRGSWQPGTAAVATAVAAVACTLALRYRPGAWAFAPAALLLLLPLRFGNVRDVEVLLGIFACCSAVMAGLVRDSRIRGGYLVGLRVLGSAFITVVVADVTDSAAAVTMVVAVLLMLQHVLTLSLRRRHVDVAFQQATTWAALFAQLLLPGAYLLLGDGFARDYDGGGRWVVMAGLGFVPIAAAFAWRFLGIRGSQYLGAVAIGALVIATGPALRFPTATRLSRPLLNDSQVPVVLLGLAVSMVVIRIAFPPRPAPLQSATPGSAALQSAPPESLQSGSVALQSLERWFWLASSLAFVLTGGLLTLPVDYALTGLSALVLAAVLFSASHVEGLSRLYAAAAPLALLGAVPAVEGLLRNLPSGVWAQYAVWLLGAAGAGAVLYAVKMFGPVAVRSEVWRRNSLAVTAAAGLASAAVVGMIHDETALVAFVLVAAAGALVVAEVPRGKWLAGEVAGVLAVAALQRALLFVGAARTDWFWPEWFWPHWFWTVQWYVVAAAVIAGLRYFRGQRREGLLRLCVGAGILSLTSLGTIFGGTAGQQLYVLVAHVVLLAAGLVLAERVLVGWGAVGVVLSIMWALRTYAFAMLALVAVGLIVLAVWRLNRKPPAGPGNQDHSDESSDPAPSQGYGGIR